MELFLYYMGGSSLILLAAGIVEYIYNLYVW